MEENTEVPQMAKKEKKVKKEKSTVPYWQTEKGKEAAKRYRQSDKGKAARARYAKTSAKKK